ncbi:helix-turn-helix domain-containing protein [Nonomuraea fuscirosea]|uniref:helix-turn-helix domain-containing protein n=1 Tax=Nonomuraea fuscirosea TaxID=1291556 RepID=UPI00342A9586
MTAGMDLALALVEDDLGRDVAHGVARRGVPPGSYVERVRVEAAQRALAEGDDPVEAIARRCGFGTAETLRRTFHRRVGIAPSDYRDRFHSTAMGGDL